MTGESSPQKPGSERFPRALVWLDGRLDSLYPLIIPAAILLIMLVSFVMVTSRWDKETQKLGGDFPAFYMAGEMVLEGDKDRIYDREANQKWQDRFYSRSGEEEDTHHLVYLNPPHLAWFLARISRWGYMPALYLWWALSLGALALSAMLWKTWFKSKGFSLALGYALCFPAVFWTLTGGQNSMFSLLFLTGFCWLLLQGRDFRAGLVLALQAFKPQIMLIPALYLLVRGRWRALGGFVAGGIGILIFTLVAMGPASLIAYLKFGSELTARMEREVFPWHLAQNLYWLPYQFSGGTLEMGLLRAIWLVASILLLGLMVWLFRGRWDPSRPQLKLALAGMLFCSLVVSPHLFIYDVALCLLPAMLLLSALDEDERLASWKPLIRPFIALSYALLISDMWFGVFGSNDPTGSQAGFHPTSLVLLSAYLLTAYVYFKTRGGAQSTRTIPPESRPEYHT